jgi:pSer/pThr/pTyr-binding forkhead associated (FHA) protein
MWRTGLGEEGWRIALPDRDQLIVGRSDVYSGVQPDIDLGPYGASTHGISRRHARLTRDQGRYRIEDLQSANLTYVNDQRLNAGMSLELQDGDRLLFGNLSVVFRVL